MEFHRWTGFFRSRMSSRWNDRKGQAIVEYFALLFFVIGVAAAIFVFVVPTFRNFMHKLMSIVVEPFVH